MYVAAKGGERAIRNARALLASARRGDPRVPELGLEQIKEQLRLAVDRVMNEGSVYDADLAALALKQASGDMVEAIFLLRAYRATLPRLGYTAPVDTGRMRLWRRISATFKDLPGGQVLGPTYDYTQRLLDFGSEGALPVSLGEISPEATPRVVDLLGREGLIEPQAPPPGDPEPLDLTREPLSFPASRAARLPSGTR